MPAANERTLNMWFPGASKLVGWLSSRFEVRGRVPGAIRVASFYARRRPRDPMGWDLWALILIRSRRYAEALDVVRQGMVIHPDSFELRTQLARILGALGRLQEAQRAWEELRADYPGSGTPWFGLATLAATRKSWDEALALIGQAQSLGLSTTEKIGAASTVLDGAGDRRRAEHLLRQAADERPSDPSPHLLLAVLLEGTDPMAAAKHRKMAKRYAKYRPKDELDQIASRGTP